MMKKHCAVGLSGVACLIMATVLPGLADEGSSRMVRGQMQSGHDQGEGEEHSAHYLKHLLKHAKEIGLTSEQIAKLKAMQLEVGRSQTKAEADIKIAKLELHALMDDEQADMTAIGSKVDQLKKAEGALLLAAIKGQRDAMSILTPDQREKDRAHHEQMKSGSQGQRRGGMGGMGRGGKSGGGHGGGGSGEHQSGEKGGEQQHQH